MHVVSTQFNDEELEKLLRACKRKGCARYTFVKQAILKEVESELSGRKGTELERPTGNDRQLEGRAKRIKTKVGEFVEFGGRLYKIED